MKKIANPVLTIGIPTCNRSNYLNFLLNNIKENFYKFTFNVEILICDNASFDDTEEICYNFSEILPIRYIKNKKNIGGEKNYLKTQSLAVGDYYLYLADDDLLIIEEVVSKINYLIENKNIVALYSPWYLYDGIRKKITGQFYNHEKNILINKLEYYNLAEFILKNKIFSEIGIFKTDILKSVLLINEISFWAFSIPGELCSTGSLYYDRKPFYVSITRHPEDGSEVRRQAGNEEVQVGWDRYRGGLEHLFGLAKKDRPHQDAGYLKNLIENIITERMLVALKLRLFSKRNPVDSYFLASRVRGRGINIHQMDIIRMNAALFWLGTTIAEFYGCSRLVLSKKFEINVVHHIKSLCDIEVEIMPLELSSQDIVLDFEDGDNSEFELQDLEFSFYITENNLLSKFP